LADLVPVQKIAGYAKGCLWRKAAIPTQTASRDG
jgi:hypothetical protein